MKPGFGVVIRSELAPGAKPKQGVSGFTDTGQRLFGFYLLDAKQADTGSYAGAGLPAWIRVTWREGDVAHDYGKGWKGGKIVGDYRVEVASRIPLDVQRYAAAGRDRAVRLIFRIKDDGVAMAWNVQEVPPSGGGGWVFSMHGGDFKPAVFFNGKLVERGWVILPDGRKVETDR